MKHWIVLLAISSMSACGGGNSDEESTSSTASQPAATQPVAATGQQPAAPVLSGQDSAMRFTGDTGRGGAPLVSPRPDPNHPQNGKHKPHEKPEPEVLDIAK